MWRYSTTPAGLQVDIALTSGVLPVQCWNVDNMITWDGFLKDVGRVVVDLVVVHAA